MTIALSPNTQVILLLSAPLIVGRAAPTSDLLTPAEYKRLARFLMDRQRQPAHLLTTEGETLLRECHAVIDMNRLKRLLARGFQLSQAMERWQARAIWVISRADSWYPKRLKAHLKEDAPALLYGCGEFRMLDSGGLAVVGSRNVDDDLIQYTKRVGRLAAVAGRVLVSGGARGGDLSAMGGALEVGGRAVGMLADSLERAALSRDNRNPLMEGRLVLISPYDPSSGFNVGHAMNRNKLIYALADAALVVNADLQKGGTWAGAVEQLEKLHFVPVFVRSSGKAGMALDALQQKGALPWPNPLTAEELNMAMDVKHLKQGAVNVPDSLACEAPSPHYSASPHDTKSSQSDHPNVPKEEPAAALFAKVREILQSLPGPNSDAEIATLLNISKSQAKDWLDRSVQEGWGEKHGKPARYHFHKEKQPDLFDDP